MTWIATIRADGDAVRVCVNADSMTECFYNLSLFIAGWRAATKQNITIEGLNKTSRKRDALHIVDEAILIGEALRTKSS